MTAPPSGDTDSGLPQIVAGFVTLAEFNAATADRDAARAELAAIKNDVAYWKEECLSDQAELAALRERIEALPALADTAPEATPHECETCADCIHFGQKCCGCYDGACCQAEATP